MDEVKKKASPSKLKYNKKYDENNYFRMSLKIRFDYEDVIEKLKSVESKNAYIIDLIRKDVEESKGAK